MCVCVCVVSMKSDSEKFNSIVIIVGVTIWVGVMN